MPKITKYADGLTLKQKRFVEEYIKNGGNGTRAAEAAGYSKKTCGEIAYENMKKPQIKNHFQKSLENIEERLGITAEWKAKMLKRCVMRCMPKEKNKSMRPTGMINAISELNKMQGHYAVVKSEVNANVSISEDIQKAREIARSNLSKPKRRSKSEKS